MIDIKNKVDCCGCTACVSICPKNCISFKPDAEGFSYPKVDLDRCINCNLCEKVCPIINPESNNNPLQVVCSRNKNEQTRAISSSGGLFSLFAQHVLDREGTVVGCALNQRLDAKHILIESFQELHRLNSSKYVQSDLNGLLPLVKKDADAGKPVLFSGTPCQVAGLKRFLRKDYPNVLFIDVLCHGVPSPKLYNEYLQWLSQKYESAPVSINFRDKKRGWKRLHIKVEFENGKSYYQYSGDDPYMSLFLHNQSQRPACFECPFNTTRRQGDITLGDFWGFGRVFPDEDDDKGLSMIMINNQKGMDLWGIVGSQTNSLESTLEMAIAGNGVLTKHIQGLEKRNKFYADFVSNGFEAAIAKHTYRPSKLRKLYYRVARMGLDLTRKVLHKGY